MFEGIMQPMHLLVILIIALCSLVRLNWLGWARDWATAFGISRMR
ncbi:MAG TPA: hypothetical protein VN679_01965 [Candidatus Acidoferrales bacterium]|nr:hypothetical protein [Candidatus Acidoferrales bacterium]